LSPFKHQFMQAPAKPFWKRVGDRCFCVIILEFLLDAGVVKLIAMLR